MTQTELGAITGGGLTGFGIIILLSSLIADRIGFGPLMFAAFIMHLVSAALTLATGAAFAAGGKPLAFQCLFWGMFLFAFANGTLEAVANPLVATLFPKQRTHYLNILHAAWPAGMILGVTAGWLLDDKMALSWKLQLALYLIPTAAYGLMFLGQKYPKSEAAAKGASFVEMFKSVGIIGALVACYLLALFFGDLFKGVSPESANLIGYGIGGALLVGVAVMTKFSLGSFLLFVLFVTHALVGAVELGTDGWIQNITGNLFTSEQGKYLFLWTSAIMFGLRFCAHWLETKLKLSPIGLLLACSVLAFIGLSLAVKMETFGMALVALGIYAIGKTFFWPTMLAVVGDRFPHTGAIAMSIMGGIGMMSAGLIGSPGLGYAKDRFTGEALLSSDAALHAEYKAEKPSTFLNIPATAAYGLDGKKLAAAKEATDKTDAQKAVVLADQKGDRATLKADSFIPLIMAGIYLMMFLYFKTIGGYKPLSIEEMAGGVQGPVV